MIKSVQEVVDDFIHFFNLRKVPTPASGTLGFWYQRSPNTVIYYTRKCSYTGVCSRHRKQICPAIV